MNDPATIHPVELSVRRTLQNAEAYVRREPVKAVGTALGIGLVLTMLPLRSLTKPAALLGSALLQPTLLGLGLIKAFELCCQTADVKAAPPPPDSP
ncbi:hypothetical protein [Prosthecobacter sp.]|uniref:hypothetical protein n=1 Tax=Prosthecobacter sp. TaxID=1965333 RepID=UPI00378338D4